ncbi:nucleoside/nucleotide kinase family protein [Vibrio penaeicida]|uniref:Nucleoside triphosphate hydrolase n=1 Tax=Vibrio penaeicida TaxID=104609 RepID=A0AAV5NQS2_9VIBR|nr:AAA family ATPase [Vibrio penaeicida]GLQ72347.1 nucleoside triphosphate hydrolase [Vibrio penaeicida]
MNHAIIRTICEKAKRNRDVILVGISGAPGAGKSTLALALVDALNHEHAISAQYCPMDGYHFTNKQLHEKQLTKHKGRIDTFDAQSMKKDIDRLRSEDKPFYWPAYSRELHNPIKEGVEIRRETRVFIVEGNYIFFNTGEWRCIRDALDLKIFIDVPRDVLKRRLIERHLTGGKSEQEAQNKVNKTDLPNASLISSSSSAADIVIDPLGKVLDQQGDK